MPRLVLINPADEHKGMGRTKISLWTPLSLSYIAALTPKEYEIILIDENIEPFKFIPADIVGITGYTSLISRAYEIAQQYKLKGIPTVMGGIHVSMLPDEALKYCDSVVIGEAETVWPQVLKDFESQQLKKKYYGTLTDLADLPIPRRDILANKYYKWGGILTSRGCPMNCSFCSVTAFNGGKFRRRPLNSVIDELKLIPQKKIMIMDDNIIGYGEKDKAWARSFFSSIIQNRINKYFLIQATLQFGEDQALLKLAARAGVRIVLIGMESVNPKSLKAFNKRMNLKQFQHDQYHQLISNIRRAGILVLGAFIVGGDDDNISIFKHTLDFINESHIDILQLSKPTPLPGTKLWEEIHSSGRIINNAFPKAWEEYRLTKMVYEPKQMSVEDVYIGSTYLRSLYYGPKFTLKRTLSTLITTKNIYTTLMAYFFNSSLRKGFTTSEHYLKYNNPLQFKKFEGLNE